MAGKDEMFRLIDENGCDSAYEVLDVIEYDGEEYAVLFPLEEGANGAVILRIIPSEGDDPETYVGVEEDTMNEVFRLFRAAHKDELGE